MSTDDALADELSELMVLCFDGVATDRQFARLQHLMETSEEARRFFLLSQADCVSLRLPDDSLVETEGLEPADPSAEIFFASLLDDEEIDDLLHGPPPEPLLIPLLPWEEMEEYRQEESSAHPWLSWLRAHPSVGMAVCIVLLISTLLCFSPPPQAGRKGIPSGTTLAGEVVGAAGCRWANGCEPSTAGDRFFIGQQFKLEAGLLEIAYASGAKVILEGPATYQVNSTNSGFLAEGKLTGKVTSSSAKGFTVRTPTATVIDVGTEFGIEVAKTGETTSHVFRGAVNLVTMTTGGESTGFILSENASARVERSREHQGDPIVVPCGSAKPKQFVREEQLTPLVRWQSQVRDMRRAPAMLAYYDFQQRNGSALVLPNVGPKGGSTLDGTVKHAAWCDGPVLGRRALEFSGPSDYVWLNVARSSESLSLAAWIYVQSLENEFSALLMSESATRPGQVSWGILRDGSMVCDIQGMECEGRPHVQSAAMIGPELLRRWIHVAVTYDRQSRRVCFYRDGQAVSDVAVTADQDVPVQIGPATIGRWRDDKVVPQGGPRNFLGRISELAIVGGSLLPEEVHRMYDAGLPPKE